MKKLKRVGSICSDLLGSVCSGQVGSISSGQVGSLSAEFPAMTSSSNVITFTNGCGSYTLTVNAAGGFVTFNMAGGASGFTNMKMSVIGQ